MIIITIKLSPLVCQYLTSTIFFSSLSKNGSENCAPICSKIGEGNRMQDAMNFMKLMNAMPMKRPEQRP